MDSRNVRISSSLNFFNKLSRGSFSRFPCLISQKFNLNSSLSIVANSSRKVLTIEGGQLARVLSRENTSFGVLYYIPSSADMEVSENVGASINSSREAVSFFYQVLCLVFIVTSPSCSAFLSVFGSFPQSK